MHLLSFYPWLWTHIFWVQVTKKWLFTGDFITFYYFCVDGAVASFWFISKKNMFSDALRQKSDSRFFFSFSEKAASTSGKRLSNLDLPESNLPRWFQSSDHWMATHVPFLPQNGCAWDKYHLMPSSPPEFLRILSTNTHELHNRRGTNSWLTSLQPTRTLSHAKLCTWLQRQRPTPWRKEAKTG